MKFHVTLEHDQPDKDAAKKKSQPKAAPAPQPTAPPSKPKKTTSNKNVSPPTQSDPKGAQTVKRATASAKRNTTKTPAKNTGAKPAAKSAPAKKTSAKGSSNPASPAAQSAPASGAQKRVPQPGPLLGSRWPTANGQNPPGNPMEQVANQPAGSLLPPTPPKEPLANQTTQAMRARQSNVLKKRQARELAGNDRGAPREADASSGFWPPLII